MSGGNRRVRSGENRQTWPGALVAAAIVLIMIAAGGAIGSARASPTVPPPPPGGSCPSSASITFGVNLMTNATNETIQYWVVFQYSYQWDYSNTNVSFGPNTSYDWRMQTNQPTGTTYPNNAFIDLLDPSSTYYFALVGWASCTDSSGHHHIYNGYYYGEWTNKANTWNDIQGTVFDANGHKAPAGVGVYVTCARPYPHTSWSNYGLTVSTGWYWVGLNPNIQGVPFCDQWGSAYTGLNVSIENGNPIPIWGQSTTTWSGHWNETIRAWDSQILNFYLPLNYDTSYMPVIVDFSNSPYTQLSVAQSTGYENSYSYNWAISGSVGGDVSFGGGLSGSTTETSGFTMQHIEGVNSGTFCWAAQYVATGSVGFSAMTRGWSYALNLFNPFNGNFCANVGVAVPSNWIPNGTSSLAYYLSDPGTAWANGMHKVGLQGTQFIGWGLSWYSTQSISTGYSVSVGLSASILGVAPLSFQASASWSQSVSTSTSTTFSGTLNGPGVSGKVACYNVVGEGASSGTTDADAVAIFYWQGSLQNGVPAC